MSFGQLRPIIGGGPASEHEYPFVVHLSIETRPSWHAVCGGTLLSPSHIVTAAHCLFHAPSPHAVNVGYGHAHIQRQKTVRAHAFHIHQDFDARTLANDIAIIELESPIRETREAHRVPVYFGPVPGGQLLRTMGWGVTSNDAGEHTVARMNRVDLLVAAPRDCRRVDRAFLSSNGPFVCTSTSGGRDECSGDSGAPAILIEDGRFAGSRSGGISSRFWTKSGSAGV
ncbi:Transmembrane protease serine 11D, partial [Coemansia sp. IMI 209127]